MRIVTAVALLGTASVMSGCAIQQPSAGCQVQDGVWQAAYLLKNPADASKSCGTLKGEAIGTFKYVKYDEASRPSYVGIRPQRAAELAVYTDADGETQPRITLPPGSTSATDPTGALKAASTATSLSKTYATQPDAKGLCMASDFSSVTVAANAYTVKDHTEPAETVSYAFGNVNIYSAASAPGSQLEGTLVYGDGTGCTAEYRVLALWPQVMCDTDADCSAENGLNPDFDAVCLPDINPDGSGGCVPNPAKGVGAFK